MPTEWVNIKHPKIKGSETRVSKRSFDRVWSKKDYVLVEDDTDKKGGSK